MATPPAPRATSARRAGSRCMAAVTPSEPDVDVAALGPDGLEVRPRVHAGHPGDQVRRERLGSVVECLDRAVVELAGVGDLVLRVAELVLERHEVLVGL